MAKQVFSDDLILERFYYQLYNPFLSIHQFVYLIVFISLMVLHHNHNM